MDDSYGPESPLANHGPQALQELLTYGAVAADGQLRLLDLSELAIVADALDELAGLARRYIHKTCGVCGTPIWWNPNEPTRQAAGWRHLDQPAYYRLRQEHRATPGGDPR